MKNIMKVVLFLLILFFSNQSSTQGLTLNLNSIVKIIFDTIMEIDIKENDYEENENKDEENMPNVKNNIFGPYETDLILEVLVSIFRCKTITDRLYSLNLDIEYNTSYILNKTEKLLEKKNFDVILKRIFKKINICNFEVWLKLIRLFIEKVANLPAISEDENEYVINYRNGFIESIPKEKVDYNIYRVQKRQIKINEFLNNLENFMFYCYKIYSFATYNFFDNYVERFAGTTFSKLFNGLSPLTFLF